ncbi:MAG TPA: type III polyketide synthase, partial [Cytophagales bacterium]|nr:type III polyketide synthase [Cytophagales bacterium]
MSYITHIGISNPEHQFAQQTIGNFMVKAMKLDSENARKLHALYRATGIETRYSVLADYGKIDGFQFFPDNNLLEPFPTTSQRLTLYREHAVRLSVNSINQCLNKFPSLSREEITHLVVVSCTGMYAPGLDIDLVKNLGLNNSIHRTCINFMGCYAAFNAMKLADAFCAADSNAKVIVVCTELCSIHFQKENSDDNLLANALFADGSAALLVEATPRQGLNLCPLNFHCDLATNGADDMAWKIGDHGFEMKLSTYVPEIIRSGIKK